MTKITTPRRVVPVVDGRHAIPADAEHFVDCMQLADKDISKADPLFRFMSASGQVDELMPGTRPASLEKGAYA